MGHSESKEDKELKQWKIHIRDKKKITKEVSMCDHHHKQPLFWLQQANKILNLYDNQNKLQTYVNDLKMFYKKVHVEKYIKSSKLTKSLRVVTEEYQPNLRQTQNIKANTTTLQHSNSSNSNNIRSLTDFQEVLQNINMHNQELKQQKINDLFSEIFEEVMDQNSFVFEIARIWSDLFVNKFSLFCDEQLLQNLQSEQHQSEFVVEAMHLDTIQFIEYLEELLMTMYIDFINSSIRIKNSCLDQKLRSIILKVVFQQKKIYEMIIKLIELSKFKEINLFKNNILILKTIKPYQMGLHENFCLERLEQPFSKTIDFLRHIIQIQNPIDKFYALSQLRQTIHNEIQDYWMNQKQVKIETDTIQNIMIYVIIKSQEGIWEAQCQFMEIFIAKDKNFIWTQDETSLVFTSLSVANSFILSQSVDQMNELLNK